MVADRRPADRIDTFEGLGAQAGTNWHDQAVGAVRTEAQTGGDWHRLGEPDRADSNGCVALAAQSAAPADRSFRGVGGVRRAGVCPGGGSGRRLGRGPAGGRYPSAGRARAAAGAASRPGGGAAARPGVGDDRGRERRHLDTADGPAPDADRGLVDRAGRQQPRGNGAAAEEPPRPGERFRIWTDAGGRVVGQPLDPSAAVFHAGMAGLAAAICVATLVETVRRLVVRRLMHRRYIRLDRAWAAAGPDWGRAGAGS